MALIIGGFPESRTGDVHSPSGSEADGTPAVSDGTGTIHVTCRPCLIDTTCREGDDEYCSKGRSLLAIAEEQNQKFTRDPFSRTLSIVLVGLLDLQKRLTLAATIMSELLS